MRSETVGHDGSPTEDELLNDLDRVAGRLNAWEDRFVADMRRQIGYTEAQRRTIRELHRRYC